jgi:hypothetical protein
VDGALELLGALESVTEDRFACDARKPSFEEAKRYSNGATATVFHDPPRPKVSALITGIEASLAWMNLALGIVLYCGVGAVFGWVRVQ